MRLVLFCGRKASIPLHLEALLSRKTIEVLEVFFLAPAEAPQGHSSLNAYNYAQLSLFQSCLNSMYMMFYVIFGR